MTMDRDEKIAFHEAVEKVVAAVEAMNGPHRETAGILAQLTTIRDGFMDDAILSKCEGCEEVILESEMDSATMGEDGWFCSECIARWNEGPTPARTPGDTP